MKLTYKLMSQVEGKSKLYAILDKFGNTMIQVWSEKEPTEYIDKFKNYENIQTEAKLHRRGNTKSIPYS